MNMQRITGFMMLVLAALAVVASLAGLCLFSFWAVQTAHDWLHTLANTS